MALDSKSGSRKINQNVDLAPGARNLTTTGNITAGAFYGDGSNLQNISTADANDALITITAGGGLTGGGGFTVDQAADATITVSHSDTSSQASVANTAFNVIQSITLDTYGHITAIESQDIGTAGFYVKTTGEVGTGVKIGLGSLTYQTLQFFAGTGLSVVRTDNEIQFSAPNAANWNTAYGWGNHASAGYLTSYTETDTLATVTSRGNTTTDSITITNDTGLIIRSSTAGTATKINFSDHSTTYAQNGTISYTHVDSSSYGSGNAFILSGTESSMTILADGKLMYKEGIYSKPATGTGAGTRKDTNWDTAYSWGNHASAGYLTSVPTQTKLVSPNGATVVAADSALPDAGHSFIHTLALGPGGNDGHILGMTWANTTSVYGAQIFIDTDPTNTMAFRSRSNAGVWTGWNTVVHSGNIGSQSVANADTVDSLHASTFYRNIGFGSGYPSWNLDTVDADRSGFTYANAAPYTGPFIHIGASGYGLQLNAPYSGNGFGLSFRTRNGDAASWNSWRYPAVYGVNANGGGSLYSTIYYDQNNTAYYLDPEGNTVLGAGLSVGTGGSPSNSRLHVRGGAILNEAGGENTYGIFKGYNNNNHYIAIRGSVGSDASVVTGAHNTTFVEHLSPADDSTGWFFKTNALSGVPLAGRISWTSSWFRGSLYGDDSVRSPIFYDSNDTTYYLDPNSTGVSLKTAGSVISNGAFGTNGYGSGNLVGRVYGPRGATYSSGAYTVTGAIKIRLPIRSNDTMWSMKVRIYNYTSNDTSEYLIGNYSYSAGAWNYGATYSGTSNSNPKTVRFGNDGSYDCVWIGETSTVWYHPIVSVMDFMGGYANGSVENWDDNWSVTLVASFDTVSASISPDIKFLTGEATSSLRAPIFYDSNDTSYYVNPNGNSRLYSVDSPQGYVSNGNPWGTSNSAFFPNGITTAGGTNWVYGHTYLGNAPSNGSGAEVASNGRIYVRSSNTSGGHGYAGLFIDRNNAANNYAPFSFENEYGNHSWGLVSRFHITNSVGDRPSIQFSHSANNTRWSIGYVYPDDDFRITQNHGYRPDGTGNNDGWGTERFRIDTSGNTFSNVSSRAPIFYDSNNTGYYVDPASTSNVNNLYVGGESYYYSWIRKLGGGSTGLYWQEGTGQYWHIYPSSQADMRFRTGAGNGGIVGTIADETARGYIHWTTGNEIGFLNASRSWSLRVDNSGNSFATSSSRAPIFYDSNDTGYYVDPAGTHRQNHMDVNTGSVGRLGINNSSSETRYGLSLYGGYNSGEPTYGILFTGTSLGSHGSISGSWATYFTMNNDTTRGWIFRRVGSGNCASISAGGHAAFNGDVTAYYSDMRLKTKIADIENPIEKVKSLSGFIYEPNEIAESYGYEKERKVGVSAQEVQAVLPEAVKDAPIGDGYLTVQYDKLVPLLIEAIKEQQKQIEELKAIVDGLTK